MVAELHDARSVNPTARKLKILIPILYYFPHRTGLTIHVQHVAEELVRRGHDVTVLTARYQQDMSNDTVMHNGVRVVRLWAPIKLSRGMLMPSYPWALYQFMLDMDVVSIHTPTAETAIASTASRLTGCPMIATHHGDLVLPDSLGNRLLTRLMFGMYSFMAKRLPAIIAYSQDYAENSYYLQPFLDKVVPTYPPIKMPTPNWTKVEELRSQWQYKDGPIIGYSGRFVQEKRPDLLIKALDVINKHHPDARVVFAGEYDIPYEDTWDRHRELVERNRDQLIFLGLIQDPQDMADFYAACDVLALPSDTECFALVQVEAMLSGTPVVMTNTPGGRVPVTVTGMGKIAEMGNAESIGQALVDVLDDPETYHRTREEIESVFCFRETVDRYESLLLKYAREPYDD